jgi:Tfp pilus assembly protein PilN
MKLNLLPAKAKKSTGGGGGGGSLLPYIIGSVVIALLGIGAAVAGIFMSQQQLAAALEPLPAKAQAYQRVDGLAKQAEPTIARAATINRNVSLAQAITAHSSKHLDLYEEVFDVLPSYFRLTQISSAVQGPDAVTVTLNGVVDSFQRYSDINLALLQVEGAVNVTPSGYVIDSPAVPGLNEIDQVGRPIRPGETNLPSDDLERMAEMEQRAAATPRGFLNQGGFGDLEADKGAMPGFSAVSYVLTIAGRNLQAPDPGATLTSGGGAAAAGGPGAPFGAPPAGLGGGPGGDDIGRGGPGR